MDLNKEKTDSGLLNEIKDLMNKRSTQEPKKQDSDDNFDEMIQELDNAQKNNMRNPPQQETNNSINTSIFYIC